MAALPDGHWYTFELAASVRDLAGHTLGTPHSFEIGGLLGDANNDGRVDVGDLVAVRAHLREDVGPDTVRVDLNLDARINVGDLLMVRGRDGESLE